MIKVIVFDFDGVLVNSNMVKREAYYEALAPIKNSSEILQTVLIEHPEYDRYAVTRAVLSQCVGEGRYREQQVDEYAFRYNRIVQHFIARNGLVDGVCSVLNELSRNRSLYINSATPRSALEESVKILGITSYFREIYGSPQSKADNLGSILKSEFALGRDTVVVGDGESDYGVARACGCHFIGIRNEFNKWDEYKDFAVVSHINDILSSIRSLDDNKKKQEKKR